jgi:hypothetical protein
MRAVWVLGFAAIGGSCSAPAQFDASCARVVRGYCQHQVECGIHYDELVCQQEEEVETYCRPSTSIDTFRTCDDELKTLSCDLSIGPTCADILCDRNLGCKEEGTQLCTETPDGGANCPE